MVDVVECCQDEQVCQVGSVFYYLCMVIFMVWEVSCQVFDQCCLVLVFLVVWYKLLLCDLLYLEGWIDQVELLVRVVGEVLLSQVEVM